MRGGGVRVNGMRIGARQHHHIQRAAPGDQIAERVTIAQPRTAVMQRDVGGIVGHVAARTQARAVGVDAAEVVEPEVHVETAGVVLRQRQLRPAQRFVEPVVCRHHNLRSV